VLRPLIWRTLITNFALTALGLVNSILLSRWLGPAGRGEVAAAMLWPTLLVYLSSMGLIAGSLYFAALPESKPQAIFANGLWLGLTQGAVAILIGFVALPWLLRSQAGSVIGVGRIFLLVIPISLITQYGISILQGQMRIVAFNWLRLILPAGYLLGTVVLIASGGLTLLNIILLHLLLNVIVLAATLIELSRSGVRLRFGVDGRLAKKMVRYGAKVHVGSVSGLANSSLDQVLLAAFLPSRYLGLYVAAVGSAGVAQVFSLAVQMVSTPSIAQRKSVEERTAVLRAVFRRYWILSLPVALALAAILPFGIPIIFGAEFKDAIWAAEILLIGSLLIGARDVLSGGANALGDPWLGSKAQLWAMGVTVILLCALLPVLGIIGAAIASAAACAVQLGVIVYGLRVSHAIPSAELFRIDHGDISSAFQIFTGLKEQLGARRMPTEAK
jgi:O-antigen/teichoic acid export membrane protein